MSDLTKDPDGTSEESEEYPGIGRWNDRPGDIVLSEKEGVPVSVEGSETQSLLTPEQRKSQCSKFTWQPGDVEVHQPGDPECDDADELVERPSVEDRWHGEARDIKVTSKSDPDYKGPTT